MQFVHECKHTKKTPVLFKAERFWLCEACRVLDLHPVPLRLVAEQLQSIFLFTWSELSSLFVHLEVSRSLDGVNIREMWASPAQRALPRQSKKPVQDEQHFTRDWNGYRPSNYQCASYIFLRKQVCDLSWEILVCTCCFFLFSVLIWIFETLKISLNEKERLSWGESVSGHFFKFCMLILPYLICFLVLNKHRYTDVHMILWPVLQVMEKNISIKTTFVVGSNEVYPKG